jgi:hypothetical protein
LMAGVAAAADLDGCRLRGRGEAICDPITLEGGFATGVWVAWFVLVGDINAVVEDVSRYRDMVRSWWLASLLLLSIDHLNPGQEDDGQGKEHPALLSD